MHALQSHTAQRLARQYYDVELVPIISWGGIYWYIKYNDTFTPGPDDVYESAAGALANLPRCPRIRDELIDMLDSFNEARAHPKRVEMLIREDCCTPAPETLDELQDLLQREIVWQGAPLDGIDVDWASLPVFGGDEPSDTLGIWSWNETEFLVSNCAGDLEIVPREEWEE